jgi:putative acetyltransferase
VILRRERTGDRAAVRAVPAAAFARPDGAVPPEVRLVEQLRADGDVVPGLALVAELDGQVAGHVVCSRATIGGRPVLGLGPLGVLPGRQRAGVGSALVHGVLAAADALAEPCVVLLGSPDYYRRFGFLPAAPLGVRPPEPAWGAPFQLRRLSAWDDGLAGAFRYAPAFDRL